MGKLDVAKHNALIDATSLHTFSQFEQQFVAEALSRISMDDDSLKIEEIDVDSLYYEVYGTELQGKTKREVYDKLRGLTEKSITINTSRYKASFSWLSLFQYDKDTRTAKVMVNPDGAKFLLNLAQKKDGFTKIKRDVYMLMTNTYGTRLLELMSKVYGIVSERKFEIDEIRSLLQVGDKYSSVYNLKRYVIEPAIEQVNEVADFTLSYEQLKTGRRITHIKFIKHPKDNNGETVSKDVQTKDGFSSLL